MQDDDSKELFKVGVICTYFMCFDTSSSDVLKLFSFCTKNNPQTDQGKMVEEDDKCV